MIKKLKLTNFRKFSNLELDLNNKIVVITGANAVGKTSILEAIYLIATSKSHRTNVIENIITMDKEFSTIELRENKEYKTILHS
ncbi:MAG: AAA family ATPase, partial [Anaeroplasmataceae bacterium]|nr:AAA family ATPase [Anaeroplasmataceae bacterium]